MKKEVNVWRRFPRGVPPPIETIPSLAGGGTCAPSATKSEGQFAPACDIEENDNEFRLSLDLPGLEKNEITIEVYDGNLRVQGERQEEPSAHPCTTHRRERNRGHFERTFHIPANTDSDRVTAEYGDGVLTVALPKVAGHVARRVEVKDTKFEGAHEVSLTPLDRGRAA